MLAGLLSKASTSNGHIRNFLGEFYGTFILCLVGNGAVHAGAFGSGVNVALAYGLAVAFGIYSCAKVTGGHINPAVTIGFWSLGKLGSDLKENTVNALVYILAQISGAFVSSMVLSCLFSASLATYEGDKVALYATAAAAGNSALTNLLDQVFTTMIFVSTVFAVVDPKNTNPKGLGPLLIGLAAAALGMAFGANGGGAINPARDLGPRIWAALKFGGAFSSGFWWIPVVGPLLGGVLAAITYTLFISGHGDAPAAEAGKLLEDKV